MKFYCVLGSGLTDTEGEPVPGFTWQEGEESPTVYNPTLLCEWDGRSDAVTVISGVIPEGGIPFAGWSRLK